VKKIIILGGGVSGLVSAILLAKNDFEVLLIDKEESFLNSLKLHLSFWEPLKNFQKNYKDLSLKFHFQFLQKEILLSEENLLKWEKESFVDQIQKPFDYLIVTTGASQNSTTSNLSITQDATVLTLNDFYSEKWKESIYQLLSSENISFVGGGATSIQFLFELYAYLEKYKLKPKINFFTREDRLLSSLPSFFHEYIHFKFKFKNTEFFPKHQIKSITNSSINVHSLASGVSKDFPSDFTFFFPGVRPSPFRIDTNEFGQIRLSSHIVQNFFSAGDCSYFHARGDNSMSAQIAVRKARTVVQNILLQSKHQGLKPFHYKELGYFISLGGLDGIGWMLLHMNILFGPPAFVIKELIEKQLEFFITGLDTYVDFPDFR
jgi:NADH:ubiquinone reductase (H+-translocating)